MPRFRHFFVVMAIILLTPTDLFPGVVSVVSGDPECRSSNSSVVVCVGRGSRSSDLVASVSAKEPRQFRPIVRPAETPEEKLVKIATELKNGEYSAEMPDIYDHLIKEAAELYRLDFYLIKAIIMAESSFDPEAVSKTGACGLMQVMPFNFEKLGIARPFDPRESILGGSQYFREMLDEFGQDYIKAIAAYNAGPNPVRQANGTPGYPETYSYVPKVLGYYQALKEAGEGG